MVRCKSEVWNYFEINGNKTTCKFCKKEAFKNPSRMPVHLTRCKSCPSSVKTKMTILISKLSSKRSYRPSSESNVILSSPKQVSPSYMEHPELDNIADIEVDEEEVETSEVFLADEKFKLMNTERYSENGKNRKADADRNSCHKIECDRRSDEFSLFGDSVAHKLRNINNPRARAIAQFYINNVLFRAEMTNFDEKFAFPSPQEFTLFDKLNKDYKEENTSSS